MNLSETIKALADEYGEEAVVKAAVDQYLAVHYVPGTTFTGHINLNLPKGKPGRPKRSARQVMNIWVEIELIRSNGGLKAAIQQRQKRSWLVYDYDSPEPFADLKKISVGTLQNLHSQAERFMEDDPKLEKKWRGRLDRAKKKAGPKARRIDQE